MYWYSISATLFKTIKQLIFKITKPKVVINQDEVIFYNLFGAAHTA